MAKRPHALHVVHRYHPYVGGSETYFHDLGVELVRRGWRVTVVTTDAWELEHLWKPGFRRVEAPLELHEGVEIHRVPVRHPPVSGAFARWLRPVMRRIGHLPGSEPLLRSMSGFSPRVPGLRGRLQLLRPLPDVVHTSNIAMEFAVVAAERFARARGISHLCTPFVHVADGAAAAPYTMPHQLGLLRRADMVFAQTSREAEFLRVRGVAPERVRVTGCWIRPERLKGGDGAAFRARHGVRGTTILSIGAAAFDKGTVHLIRAMRRLWEGGSDATLVLVSGNVFQEVREELDVLSSAQRARVLVLESAPHQVKLDALAAAELFALPSRTESFGIVFLEAWAHGLPVIGARAGGVVDVIADGEDGLLVDFGDVEALAGAIARLSEDASLRARLGAAGRDKVLREMTLERRLPALLEPYERFMGGGSPHSPARGSVTRGGHLGLLGTHRKSADSNR
jgi:glycogen synthase